MTFPHHWYVGVNHKERDMATKFNISSADLAIIRRAAIYMKTNWRPVAARPHLAARIVQLVAEYGLEDGCEKYARRAAAEFASEHIYR